MLCGHSHAVYANTVHGPFTTQVKTSPLLSPDDRLVFVASVMGPKWDSLFRAMVYAIDTQDGNVVWTIPTLHLVR